MMHNQQQHIANYIYPHTKFATKFKTDFYQGKVAIDTSL